MSLRQIGKRISEEDAAKFGVCSDFDHPEPTTLSGISKFDCKQFKEFGQIYTVFNRLKTPNFRIDNTPGNKWVITQNEEIISVQCFVQYSDKRCFLYRSAITKKEPFFTIPISSDTLFIYAAQNKFKTKKLYKIEEIACKMFRFKYFGAYTDSELEEESPKFDSIFIPLWHTLK